MREHISLHEACPWASWSDNIREILICRWKWSSWGMCWTMGKEYFWDLREECPTGQLQLQRVCSRCSCNCLPDAAAIVYPMQLQLFTRCSSNCLPDAAAIVYPMQLQLFTRCSCNCLPDAAAIVYPMQQQLFTRCSCNCLPDAAAIVCQ